MNNNDILEKRRQAAEALQAKAKAFADPQQMAKRLQVTEQDIMQTQLIIEKATKKRSGVLRFFDFIVRFIR